MRYLILPLVLLAFGCKTYKEQPDLVDIRKFTPPAERGDAWAQYHLGQAYASHWRYVEAGAWYRKAAVQGNADAMYALGQNCLSGYGVPQNPIEAYAWFDIAASQNQLLARNARESLMVRMTRSETEEGNRRAAALVTEIPSQKLVYAYIPTKTGPLGLISGSIAGGPLGWTLGQKVGQNIAKGFGVSAGTAAGVVVGVPVGFVKGDVDHFSDDNSDKTAAPSPTTPPPAPTAVAKPASKIPATTTGQSLHYGSTVSKGGMVQTAP
ncbi:MAG: tetratricopeptide repeat protein [Verrucomicrobia bacterium]|nr:tetratricopeptide repeat protein [Verrucomicrobiota bacterium]